MSAGFSTEANHLLHFVQRLAGGGNSFARWLLCCKV